MTDTNELVIPAGAKADAPPPCCSAGRRANRRRTSEAALSSTGNAVTGRGNALPYWFAAAKIRGHFAPAAIQSWTIFISASVGRVFTSCGGMVPAFMLPYRSLASGSPGTSSPFFFLIESSVRRSIPASIFGSPWHRCSCPGTPSAPAGTSPPSASRSGFGSGLLGSAPASTSGLVGPPSSVRAWASGLRFGFFSSGSGFVGSGGRVSARAGVGFRLGLCHLRHRLRSGGFGALCLAERGDRPEPDPAQENRGHGRTSQRAGARLTRRAWAVLGGIPKPSPESRVRAAVFRFDAPPRPPVPRSLLLRAKFAGHRVPVHHLPPLLDVLRPQVLVLQVVGVLPHVARRGSGPCRRPSAGCPGSACSPTASGLSLPAHQPRPPAAEPLRRRVVERLLELVHAS